MDGKILVTYASKYGATREIAAENSTALRQAGLSTQVSPVNKATNIDAYQAVIQGSVVYIRKWRNEAFEFLHTNGIILADLPVWLFSSGPTGEGDPSELLQGWQLPVGGEPAMNRIPSRDISVFHGHINPYKLNFIKKQLIKRIIRPMGDYRNWDAISNRIRAIAQTLLIQVKDKENTMIRIAVGIFFLLHGLVHMLYFGQSARFFELQPGLAWPDGSWVLSKFLSNPLPRNIAGVLLIIAAVGFISSGIGLFIKQVWWRPVVVSTAIFSSILYLLLWDGTLHRLDNQGGVGILIDLVILAAVLIFHWPNV
jgi:menaquinone-dependent protoporphyrinogen oxidase